MTLWPSLEDEWMGAKKSVEKLRRQSQIKSNAKGTKAPIPSNPNPEEQQLKNEIIEHLHHNNYPIKKLRRAWKELKPRWKG